MQLLVAYLIKYLGWYDALLVIVQCNLGRSQLLLLLL